MIDQQARIALLIDADNSPASKIDVILAELAKVGVANIRRAYGNWKKAGLKGWEDVLHEYAIRPVQQFDYSRGKNATDMSMVIEAMELLYTDRPEVFAVVSSDSDFTPLVMHLKAKGSQVYGFGAQKTPLPFVNACTRFLYVETLGDGANDTHADEAPAAKSPAGRKRAGGRAKAVAAEAAVPAAGPVPEAEESAGGAPLKQDTKALKQDARLVTLLRNAVDSAAGDDGWSPLGAVGKQIGNQASFDPRNHGYRTLKSLIVATQLFDLRGEGTSQVSVRDKRRAKPAKA